MLKTPVLTDGQIADFHRDGFVYLPGVFADEIGLIESWVKEVAEARERPDYIWVYHEKSLKMDNADLINRIEKVAPFHDGFAELTEVLKPANAQLLGEPAVLFKEKINYKMPGGGGFKAHQDSQAGWWDYADFFITTMVCIDESTVENGCLQMVAGHHKRGLLREWEPLTAEDCEDMDYVMLPTQPGDIAFFDSYAPHGSDPNMSDKTRRLYFATYNRASDGDHMAKYYADKHKTFPPDIDRSPGDHYEYKV